MSSLDQCLLDGTTPCWYKPGPVPSALSEVDDLQGFAYNGGAPLDNRRSLNDRRSNVDVVFRVESGDGLPQLLYAHCQILDDASPLFQQLYTAHPTEGGKRIVRLSDVSPADFSLLLDMIYGDTSVLNRGTVQRALAVAKKFEVEAVVRLCSLYIERRLDARNAVWVAKFAFQNEYKVLYGSACRFIERHFSQVSRGGEFPDIPKATLISLLKSDSLNVAEEYEVLEAVVRWVSADEDGRRCFLNELVRLVRCRLIPPRALQWQQESKLVRRVPDVREYLSKVVKELRVHTPHCDTDRVPDAPVIYLAGGSDYFPIDDVEAYDVSDASCAAVPRLSDTRRYVTGAVLKGVFYVVGGDADASDCAVERYDPSQGVWQQCRQLLLPRFAPGVAAMDGFLYAVGGSKNFGRFNYAERYDPQAESWECVAPMSVKREQVAVAAWNRFLYAIGGRDVVSLNVVERYDPERNQWSTVSSLRARRHGASAAVLGHHIYVAGGSFGLLYLNTVERYDALSNTWEFIAPMRSPRYGLSLVAVGAKLYAMGGMNLSAFGLSTSEIYDTVDNEWEKGPVVMVGRTQHAAAVLYQSCLVHRGHEVSFTLV